MLTVIIKIKNTITNNLFIFKFHVFEYSVGQRIPSSLQYTSEHSMKKRR